MGFVAFQNGIPLERAFGLTLPQVRGINIAVVDHQIHRDGVLGDNGPRWREEAAVSDETAAREHLLASDILHAQNPGCHAGQVELTWTRWIAMKAEVSVIWDEYRIRTVDAEQIRDAAVAAGIADIPSIRNIRRLRAAKDALGLVAARFLADHNTQYILSGPAADLVWEITSAVDPEVQAAFILGDGVRADVIRHLRRFGFDAYARVLSRHTSARLSGAEIHDLRKRAVGWSADDFDVIDEYDFTD